MCVAVLQVNACVSCCELQFGTLLYMFYMCCVCVCVFCSVDDLCIGSAADADSHRHGSEAAPAHHCQVSAPLHGRDL